MRHSKSRLQLNRFTSWRKATLISLARNLLIHESIRTTKTKAKAVRPLAEKLISLGKKNTLSAKRQAFSILQDHKLVSLLFSDIAPRFGNRIGGYLRILNLGSRRGDNAKMVVLELIEIRKKKKTKKIKTETENKKEQEPEIIKEEPLEEKKPETGGAVKEKPPITKKPSKKFLGGLRGIFKKERDSL
ncbi:MAG: 50S ribosomal protein L17 [Candidatus Omnitrophota bacterium]